ncbi:DNA alkylation repair protein [Catellatospora aurea]|uniref:DNA alkylation repair protein n=1 Tax=Catellatospora aurea TaxID=1337874 RepID=A0ABW2GQK5_9ACTN
MIRSIPPVVGDHRRPIRGRWHGVGSRRADGAAGRAAGRRRRSGAGTGDALAAHVVGPLVARDPGLVTTMDAWAADDDLWLVRTAILHQLTYQAATDAPRLLRYCAAQAGHPDFFVRKAIGWALRDYGKTDPAAVRAFVAAHAAELSGLSRREALKHLS